MRSFAVRHASPCYSAPVGFLLSSFLHCSSFSNSLDAFPFMSFHPLVGQSIPHEAGGPSLFFVMIVGCLSIYCFFRQSLFFFLAHLSCFILAVEGIFYHLCSWIHPCLSFSFFFSFPVAPALCPRAMYLYSYPPRSPFSYGPPGPNTACFTSNYETASAALRDANMTLRSSVLSCGMKKGARCLKIRNP